jgi:arginine decarboxylase
MSPRRGSDSSRLNIQVAAGAGSGCTSLAAFDSALQTVGAANFNLIRLSSVIPAMSILSLASTPLSPPGHWGDRLYLVYAASRTTVPGAQAWAGIGWIQDTESGCGLLVEHEGGSEAEVSADIHASIASLRKGRGRLGEQMGNVELATCGVTCTDQPVCALVVAVFKTEPWTCHDLPEPSLAH